MAQSALNAVEAHAFGAPPQTGVRIWYSPRDSPPSPTKDWSQVVSMTACARPRSVGKPHLHDAHWMISSVVPMKAPSTRPRYAAPSASGVNQVPMP